MHGQLSIYAPILVGFFIGIFVSLVYIPSPSPDHLPVCQDCPGLLDDPQDTPLPSSEARVDGPKLKSRPTHQEKLLSSDSNNAAASNLKPKLVRSRFSATELGLRDKLFVGVVSNRRTIKTLALALNQTVSHHVNKLVFFVEGSEREDLRGPINLVGFANVPEHAKPLYVFEYLKKSVANNYDWFFFAPDTTYIKGFKVHELASHISIGYDVILGRPLVHAIGNNVSGLCNFDAGILLSQNVVFKILQSWSVCLSHASPEHSSGFNFAACIFHVTKLPCSETWNGKQYKLKTWELQANTLPSLILKPSDAFESSLTVFPVRQESDIFLLHRFFCTAELAQLRALIRDTKRSIGEVAGQVGERQTWPYGTPSAWQTKLRFEVLKWTNLGISLSAEDNFNQGTSKDESLSTVGAGDLNEIRQALREFCSTNHTDLRFKELLNCCRKFDPTRGMEYIVDALFDGTAVEQSGHTSQRIVRRFRMLRPLNRVEIVPVPHVTELTKVHVVLPIDPHSMQIAETFLERLIKMCLTPSENINVILAISADSHESADGLFRAIRKRAINRGFEERDTAFLAKNCWIDHMNVAGANVQLPAVVDDVVAKFGADNLFLLLKPNVLELRQDFLNRVRMNTIQTTQVFFPVPFAHFNPKMVPANSSAARSGEVHKDAGVFDPSDFDCASFYGSDYEVSKRLLPSDNGASQSASNSLVETFLRSQTLHILRATEPALRLQFSVPPRCDGDLKSMNACMKRSSPVLASKDQLASLVI